MGVHSFEDHSSHLGLSKHANGADQMEELWELQRIGIHRIDCVD